MSSSHSKLGRPSRGSSLTRPSDIATIRRVQAAPTFCPPPAWRQRDRIAIAAFGIPLARVKLDTIRSLPRVELAARFRYLAGRARTARSLDFPLRLAFNEHERDRINGARYRCVRGDGDCGDRRERTGGAQ